MAKKKYTKKQCRKLFDGKCFFCGLADYELLDSHRHVPGEEKGTYDWNNQITCCALCHRKIHTNRIKILGHHPSTSGQYYVHYIDEDGVEKWKSH